MSRRAANAFTLFEVLLAVSLGVALLVSMLVFYRQAAEVRAAVMDEAALVAGERTVMDLMTRELAGALVVANAGLALDGSEMSVRFATASLPGGGAWLTAKATETALPAQRDALLVGYRLRIVEDEYGELIVEGLERTVQRVLTPRESEEGIEIEASLVAPEIRFIRLAYWDGSAYVASWGGGDLPRAVEIVLGAEPLPEDVEPIDYPYAVFRRVVFVPGASAGDAGGAVRGLSEERGL
jgi:hypothetical protein